MERLQLKKEKTAVSRNFQRIVGVSYDRAREYIHNKAVDTLIRSTLISVFDQQLDMRPAFFWVSLLWTGVILLRPCCSFRREAVSSNAAENGGESLFEVFQVYPPPVSSSDLVGSTTCSFILMNHVFADSAG